jgi:hypothetical protein
MNKRGGTGPQVLAGIGGRAEPRRCRLHQESLSQLNQLDIQASSPEFRFYFADRRLAFRDVESLVKETSDRGGYLFRCMVPPGELAEGAPGRGGTSVSITTPAFGEKPPAP